MGLYNGFHLSRPESIMSFITAIPLAYSYSQWHESTIAQLVEPTNHVEHHTYIGEVWVEIS